MDTDIMTDAQDDTDAEPLAHAYNPALRDKLPEGGSWQGLLNFNWDDLLDPNNLKHPQLAEDFRSLGVWFSVMGDKFQTQPVMIRTKTVQPVISEASSALSVAARICETTFRGFRMDFGGGPYAFDLKEECTDKAEELDDLADQLLHGCPSRDAVANGLYATGALLEAVSELLAKVPEHFSE